MAGRRWWRAALSTATALLTLVVVSGCGAEESKADSPPAPLRILLVNDDGWNSSGIVTLRQALRAAGHQVVEVAPLADRGTSGTGATVLGQVQLGRPTPDRDVWTVSGTASDATLVGLSAVMGSAWPDLVVSGIDTQPNLGVGALQSGTVGAALTAAGVRFPAVAVSTSVRDPRRPRPAEFARTADFTVRLVAALQTLRAEGAPLLPLRTVLNVNYPGGADRARDITVTPTSDDSMMALTYRRGPRPGSLIPVRKPDAALGDDALAFRGGDVTLTDLSADPDRSAPPPRTAARLAPMLSP